MNEFQGLSGIFLSNVMSKYEDNPLTYNKVVENKQI